MSIRKALPILLAICGLGIFSASASAEVTGPVWKVMSVSNPTNFTPGDKSGSDAIEVTAVNVGGSSTGCTQEQIEAEPYPGFSPLRPCPAGSPVVPPVTIEDMLPKNLKAVEVFGVNAYHDPGGILAPPRSEAQGPPFGLHCAFSATTPSCETPERVDPGDTLVMTIRVNVETSEEGDSQVNIASVSGGGAAGVSLSDPITISHALPAYGFARGGALTGASTYQAGGHPNVTGEFFLNTANPEGENDADHGDSEPGSLLESEPVAQPKDVGFDLPAGLVGTTVGVARCTMAEVVNGANCPRNTMVGTATLIFYVQAVGRVVYTAPVFNIAPGPGEPVAFAFNAAFFPVRMDTSVLSDGEYNVRLTQSDLTGGASFYMASVTIWGDPAEHNGPGPDAAARLVDGSSFLEFSGESPPYSFGGPAVEKYETTGQEVALPFDERVPLLTNPSQCSTPLTVSLETDSWEARGVFEEGLGKVKEIPAGTATGCGELSFHPSVSMLPDTLEAGAPAGYSFNLRLPQDTEPEGLATPDVKRTSVTLPAGTVISPSAADGLGVCSNEAFFGSERGEDEPAKPGKCPNDSQVGIARIKTPALEERLDGEVYLAAPECEPCTPQDAADGKMVRLFLQVVGEGESGIVVKQELTGRINQQTGQLTVTDAEVPEVPFSELQLTLQGGERATLANPRTCGVVTTTAELEPWSTPFTPNAAPTSSFDIKENCFAPQFNPSFSAGTTSNQAGGFSPFTLAFGRGDDDEFLNGIQLQMPPGLLGMLSNVKLCGEPQAAEGTCGPESLIGETTVETGPGADPFLVKGGKVFLTTGYKGAPYGLSIVVPAKAGPYTLSGTTGKGTVVVRAAIGVNPETAALTITSDPLPTALDGIPLQLRLVNVTVGTNDNFTFNSTSCDKMAIGGVLTSVANATAGDSSSYQVTNCAALKFKPQVQISTSGRTSRADGASLDFKIVNPQGSQGTEANFARAKVELPKQLPSRLTTLQKACIAAQFESNPAGCPAASVIGIVRVSTPILPVQLTGPAYFVSHGGEAFPSLEIVLQGYGVRVDLVGSTFISKAGITSTTLKTVPDVPFSSFELYLPEGKYSALSALGDLCKSSLAMPLELTAQNGTEIHESSKIAVTGCPTTKKVIKKTKARKSGHGKGGK
jgi:hypothetical protein